MTTLQAALPSGVHQIRLPMAGNPLGHVNAYLVPSEHGYVLIDCGWDTADVLEALQAALQALALTLADISTLIVTHYHHDHYGMAGRLVAMSGVELVMHERDWEHVQKRLVNIKNSDRESDRWLARNGIDEATLTGTDDFMQEAARKYSIVAPKRTVADGETIAQGAHALEVVWTPGHSPGHICFFDRARKTVYTGDHILQPITPHVGSWMPGGEDVLGDYIASLHKMDALDADQVLPAHGEPFSGLHRRVSELLAHHDERTAQILAALREGAADAATVASRLPWTRKLRKLEDLGAWHRQFAVAETLAHLHHLALQGEVQIVEPNAGTIRYAIGR